MDFKHAILNTVFMKLIITSNAIDFLDKIDFVIACGNIF